ncbi:MAG: pyridoxamine 5'-phosphate oxidase family protein [Peptococcaceae bacterium]
MFPEMINRKKQLNQEDILRILTTGEYGVLATFGDNGYPYALPLSYVYKNDYVYFHCAPRGHKLANIANNNKVSFTVITATQVLPDKFSTLYQSVVIFGEALIIEDINEKKAVLMEFLDKYSAGFIKEGVAYMDKVFDHTALVRIEIHHITAKGRKK